MPAPAVIHCTSPARSEPRCPAESSCSISPVEHVGHGLEAAVRMIGRAHRLARARSRPGPSRPAAGTDRPAVMPRPGNGRRTMKPPPSRCLCAVTSLLDLANACRRFHGKPSMPRRRRPVTVPRRACGSPMLNTQPSPGMSRDLDVAAVRLDGLPRDRQAQAEAAAVVAALDQRREQLLDLAGRQAAARSPRPRSSRRPVRARADGTVRTGVAELQRVLNQVEDRGPQQARVRGDRPCPPALDDQVDRRAPAPRCRRPARCRAADRRSATGSSLGSMPSFIDACDSALSIMSRRPPQAAFQQLDGAADGRARCCAAAARAARAADSGLRSSWAMKPRCSEVCRSAAPGRGA